MVRINPAGPEYHLKKKDLFLAAEIANEIFKHGTADASTEIFKQGPTGASRKRSTLTDAQFGMSKIEERQQNRPILQMDFAKVTAGFSMRRPNAPNTELASNFSGVADSRATTPNAQELDLEMVTRTTTGLGVARLWP